MEVESILDVFFGSSLQGVGPHVVAEDSPGKVFVKDLSDASMSRIYLVKSMSRIFLRLMSWSTGEPSGMPGKSRLPAHTRSAMKANWWASGHELSFGGLWSCK